MPTCHSRARLDPFAAMGVRRVLWDAIARPAWAHGVGPGRTGAPRSRPPRKLRSRARPRPPPARDAAALWAPAG